jgi:hypothetical protein
MFVDFYSENDVVKAITNSLIFLLWNVGSSFSCLESGMGNLCMTNSMRQKGLLILVLRTKGSLRTLRYCGEKYNYLAEEITWRSSETTGDGKCFYGARPSSHSHQGTKEASEAIYLNLPASNSLNISELLLLMPPGGAASQISPEVLTHKVVRYDNVLLI